MNQTHFDDPMIPVPIPEQVPAKEGMAELPALVLGIGIPAVPASRLCCSIRRRAAR